MSEILFPVILVVGIALISFIKKLKTIEFRIDLAEEKKVRGSNVKGNQKFLNK